MKAFLLLLIFSVSTAFAQTNGVQSIDLHKLVEAALKDNLEIKAAESRQRALAAIPKQVSSLPDPMLSYTRWASSVETRVGPQEHVFSLSQHIPFPGKLGLMGKIAGQDAVAAQHEVEAVRRDVVFKVKSAYADLYRIDRSLAILNNYQNLLNDFSAVAATKYATGQGIQAQVLKADVEISSIAAKKLDFAKMRSGATSRLNALLNKPADSPFGRAAQIDTAKIQGDAQKFIAQAITQRQELHAHHTMVEKNVLAFKLAKKNYLPDIYLEATYITIPQVDRQFSDSGKDAFSFKIGLNLPVWPGKQKAAVVRAEEMRTAHLLEHADLQKKIEAEITDILFRIKMTEQALLLYEQGLLIQAESSLESATSAYKTGKLDFLNLLDAERMLLQFRLAYVSEQANHFRQVAALERAVGGNL